MRGARIVVEVDPAPATDHRGRVQRHSSRTDQHETRVETNPDNPPRWLLIRSGFWPVTGYRGLVRLAPTRGYGRVTRGLVAGAMCTLLTASGHLAAGGGRPDAGLLAVLALLLTAVMIGLADRRRGPGMIFALVAGSQLALHWLLELLGSHAHGSGADTGRMTLAHAVATVVAVVALSGAEHTVFAVAALLYRVLSRPVPSLPTVPATLPPARLLRVTARPVPAPPGARPVPVLGGRVPARRGPPAPGVAD